MAFLETWQAAICEYAGAGNTFQPATESLPTHSPSYRGIQLLSSTT